MFRSFFPNPRLFFSAAAIWTAFCMAVWFLAGAALEPYLNIGRLMGLPAAGPDAPFFNTDKAWLYQFVLVSGYGFAIPWYIIADNRRWLNWSVLGSITIIEVVYFNVQIGAWMNDWYGAFYNLVQEALTTPGSVELGTLYGELTTVLYVLLPRIAVLVLNLFFVQHYLFRWRRAMSFYYMTQWRLLRDIEGASQRVQEDAQRFSSIVEGLAVSFVDAIMTLLVFMPLLWELSASITELPLIGAVDGSLVWVALISAAFGTVLLGLVGIRLPGLEFQNQRVEAAFRKELVYGEDYADRARPISVRELFLGVQKNYFRLYFNYLYFNVARYVYLQGSIFVPLVVMTPSIAAGAITFGLFQQVSNAFSQVEDSFRFLANSWTTIISLISVYKRLAAFESNIPPDAAARAGLDYDDPRYLQTEANFPPPGTSDAPPAVGDPTDGGAAPLPSGA